MTTRTALWTGLALVAFASNSLLCRAALAQREIDPESFTAVRLASGASVLVLLSTWRSRRLPSAGSFGSAAALCAYAAPFSFAYLRLDAGPGALILFAAVQATMIGWGIARGERPRALAWIGWALACAGLVGLTAPGASAPDPLGAALMVLAGVAWGVYSLRGRGSDVDPLAATAGNFARSLPFAAALAAIAWMGGEWVATARGVALAVASGALASGIGYSIWYAALPGLSATRAAFVQLLVPLLAAGGGVALLGESPSLRLVLAGSALLGGVALAIRARS